MIDHTREGVAMMRVFKVLGFVLLVFVAVFLVSLSAYVGGAR